MMFCDKGFGLACDSADPQSLTKALQWYCDHPAEMRAMGERGRQMILEQWHYERAFTPVMHALQQFTKH
jgi:glycosyltransferase involved in cell wall biosynthesis